VAFAFGEHSLDVRRRELRRRGSLVKVEPQVFELLVHLLVQRDRVVSKNDLLAAVWGGRIVSDSALTARINAARRAVDDDGAAQRLIRTLPRRGWRFVGEVREVPGHDGPAASAAPAIARSDRPSIAILPFQNLSDDPAQEYFADGMVEEIITALSRIPWLSVIARNSTFTYKGQHIDITQVGRELGVRYVLEGSVRKGGNRVRIATQLIDAETSAHLWADRFDGSIEEIFELQDQVATAVAGAIEPRLEAAEIVRSAHRKTADLTAYDLYLRALPHWASCEKDRLLLALELLAQATAREPAFGAAYGVAADCCVLLDGQLDADAQDANRQRGIALARRAVQTGADDPHALGNGAGDLAFFGEEINTSIALIERALAINPSHAMCWHWSGWIRVFAGDADRAVADFDAALRLSPRDPLNPMVRAGIGMAHYLAGRFEQAAEYLGVGLEQMPSFVYGYPFLAAAHARCSRPGAARHALDRLHAVAPAADPAKAGFLRREADRDLLLDGLQLATGEAIDR